MRGAATASLISQVCRLARGVMLRSNDIKFPSRNGFGDLAPKRFPLRQQCGSCHFQPQADVVSGFRADSLGILKCRV